MDKGILGDTYYVGPCDRYDEWKIDTVYFSHPSMMNHLPLVIVKVQQKDITCLSSMPSATASMHSKKRNPSGSCCLQRRRCFRKRMLWKTLMAGTTHSILRIVAHGLSLCTFSTRALSQTTSRKRFCNQLLPWPIFFTQQQRHLLALDDFEDLVLHLIYRTTCESFSKDANFALDESLQGYFCDTVILQFNKIAKAANDNTPKMTSISPTKGSVSVKIRRAQRVKTLGPLRWVATQLRARTLCLSRNTEIKNSGKMNWRTCFKEGQITSTTAAEGWGSIKLITVVLNSLVKIHLLPYFFTALKNTIRAHTILVNPHLYAVRMWIPNCLALVTFQSLYQKT